ncbi:tyrosine-type recombinase/integrase [bacterium BD-1]|nr:tyrosine-type recombinase/integrase [Ottowia caeni]
MSNVVPLRQAPLAAEVTPAASVQSEASATFQAMCLNRFLINSKARGHTTDYINQVLSTVRSFLGKVGPLEMVTEAAYEAWTADCALVLKNARSTQRTKQKHIRRFIEYVHGAQDIQNEAHKTFGSRIVLFAHKRNSIIHTTENEAERRTPAFTSEEVGQFFDHLDADAERAMTEAPREVRALLRDKAMFYVFQEFGTRVSEVGGITWGDWEADPRIPNCGPYALLHVRQGKGARGSGKRARVVLATDRQVKDVMQWYREKAYPMFGIKITPAAPVFPSERGKGISRGEVAARFTRALASAGLDGRDLTPHSLRRFMVTTAVLRGGHEFARQKAGHKSGITTQLYTHIPFEQYATQARRLVDKVVDQSTKRSGVQAGPDSPGATPGDSTQRGDKTHE